MRVTINGEPTEIPDGLSVGGLVDRLGLAGRPCAAEVNRQVVPRAERENHVLTDGDVVEIVTLVGGG